MKLVFIGADHEVTGSCHYMEVGEKKFCIDIGMEQGRDMFENQEIPVNASEIDFVLLTHAHIDHTGLLPLLYARGFRGQVYATKATCDLSEIMLRDSAHIQQFEAEWRNRKASRSGAEVYQPIYTMEDALGAIHLLTPCEYDEVIELCEEVSIRFTDVGHLLGSSSIEVFAREGAEERTIVFSGDLGNPNNPILRNPQYTKAADFVVMESTYGDRVHAEGTPDYVGDLAAIIEETFQRGGNVVIPAFAVGRTQELLYFLRQIKEKKLITSYPDFDVFVDSPMAVEATHVFGRHMEQSFSDEAKELLHRGINPIGFPGLKLSITSDDSKEINFDPNPKVILSASGMCDAGRIRHHLKHNLWRADSSIVFVGYQTAGTLGRALLDGLEEVKLFGELIEVKARITRIQGISGHADVNGLLKWVESFTEKPPKRVFVVHGEDSVCEGFVRTLEQHAFIASAPYSGTEFDPIRAEFIRKAEPVPAEKKKAASKRAGDVFSRLLTAGQRLLSIIHKNEGLSNKDTAKFTDQINSLCDKWDR
ncbi:MAG: MBL fold metallo-hydrolase [Eubacterium sp.]|nr:MBL fold metallo-hydrolase [Eubacterium sp.]